MVTTMTNLNSITAFYRVKNNKKSQRFGDSITIV